MEALGGDERTDGRKISPFYRTSSPIRAAALPAPMKTKEKVEQGKGTADHFDAFGRLVFLSSFFCNYLTCILCYSLGMSFLPIRLSQFEQEINWSLKAGC